jgi:hypothetical protein
VGLAGLTDLVLTVDELEDGLRNGFFFQVRLLAIEWVSGRKRYCLLLQWMR